METMNDIEKDLIKAQNSLLDAYLALIRVSIGIDKRETFNDGMVIRRLIAYCQQIANIYTGLEEHIVVEKEQNEH